MYGTGFLPAEEHEFYKVERDDLYLIGTSEVPLAAMHSDEIFEPDELTRYATRASLRASDARPAPTARTRRVSIRVHQFDKVEQFSFAHPDDSWDEYDDDPREPGDDPAGSRDPVPGARDVRRRSRRGRPRRRSITRPGSPALSATWRSPRRRTPPTTRRAGSRSACGGRREPSSSTRLNGTAVRRRPHDRGPAREPPARRRLGGDPGGAAALHRLRTN